MGFFDRGTAGSDTDAPPRPSKHDVPVTAQRRSARTAGDDLFASGLSVNAFALLPPQGPRSIATVMGNSVFHVGAQYLPPDAQWSADDLFCQLDMVSRAWEQARRHAFDRLAQAATRIGANAVLDVRLERGTDGRVRHSVQYRVSGSAVRWPGRAADPAAGVSSGDAASRAPRATAPLLSDLSVQDHQRLAAAGWHPAGVLATTAVFFVAQGGGTRRRRRRTVMRNQELTEFSEGFSAVRRTAVRRLRDQARALGADGILGIEFESASTHETLAVTNVRRAGAGVSAQTIALGADTLVSVGGDKRAGVVVTVHATGTAIRRRDSTPAEPALAPVMPSIVLDLND